MRRYIVLKQFHYETLRKPNEVLQLTDEEAFRLLNGGVIKALPIIETASREPPEKRKRRKYVTKKILRQQHE